MSQTCRASGHQLVDCIELSAVLGGLVSGSPVTQPVANIGRKTVDRILGLIPACLIHEY
jgi:hypothetical protein